MKVAPSTQGSGAKAGQAAGPWAIGGLGLLLGLVGAELVTAFVSVPAGAAVHAVLVLTAVNVAAFARPATRGLSGRSPWGGNGEVAAVVALIGAMRLVTLTVPVGPGAPGFRAVVLGAPVLAAGLLLARHVPGLTPWAAGAGRRGPSRANAQPRGAGRGAVVLREPPWALAGAVRSDAAYRDRAVWAPVLAGLAAGALAGAGRDQFTFATEAGFVAAALALIAFAAVTEEVLFRRLLLACAQRAWGARAALALSTVAFTAVYVPSRSASAVVAAAGAGLVFGWAYQRSGSVLGPALGHSLATVGAVLVWPVVL